MTRYCHNNDKLSVVLHAAPPLCSTSGPQQFVVGGVLQSLCGAGGEKLATVLNQHNTSVFTQLHFLRFHSVVLTLLLLCYS